MAGWGWDEPPGMPLKRWVPATLTCENLHQWQARGWEEYGMWECEPEQRCCPVCEGGGYIE